MKTQSPTKFFINAKNTFLVMTMILGIFAGAAFADDIRINMQGSTATVPKGNTLTRNLFNIPNGIPGQIRLKLKWHTVNILPTYNPLRVQLRHGNRILRTTNCYSVHSNRNPKCNINFNVSLTEANRNGNWNLRITNNSNFEVMGFDIEKGTDINPLVQSFRSIYRPSCPSTVNLDMEGETLTLTKGSTQTRRIYSIGNAAGTLKLKAKWHAVNIIPAYNLLRIQLLRPNGTVARSGNYYSYHAPRNRTPKFNITYNITAAEAAQTGSWKLKITNNSNFEVMGFNIEKESGEINPLVRNFKSTYKATCSF